ncbi:hypothetical protein Sps_03964 [Shewanella psychrophila]|uniref:Uncharacterized protein n=1 Tax=Shewanella psychrophila TaxID=225848 RepID=A0A1S6HUC0_9GAMM|nr:hypothetical protein [Shewanella psychrophila]AQS39079.1 hypothetical protein Sps_03964 [Shewanella psychrophila]
MKNIILLIAVFFIAVAQGDNSKQVVFQWTGKVPMADEWHSKPLDITEQAWQKGLNLDTRFITSKNQAEITRHIMTSLEQGIDKDRFTLVGYHASAKTYKLIIEPKI